MTTSSILRLVSRRANKLSTVASHSHPTIIRSFSAAPAALASSTTNSETDIRGAAAVMVAAVAATGAGLISWKSERADCTAITAVVGKDGFGARNGNDDTLWREYGEYTNEEHWDKFDISDM
eukprot:scaffold14294_cov165-Skeletonema_dohrnii-CCMP3373.AAC.1